MRIVALEEAFWVDGLQTQGSFVAQHPPNKPEALREYADRLIDFTAYRLPEMDRCGIDVQVLSLTSPGVQMQTDTTAAVEDARVANDFLADIIGQYPGRFAALRHSRCRIRNEPRKSYVAQSVTSGCRVRSSTTTRWAIGSTRISTRWCGLNSNRSVCRYTSVGRAEPGGARRLPRTQWRRVRVGCDDGRPRHATHLRRDLRSLPRGDGDRGPHGRVPPISADPLRLPPSRPRHPRAGPPTVAVLRHQREDHDVGGLLARRAVGRNRCDRRRKRHVRRRLSLRAKRARRRVPHHRAAGPRRPCPGGTPQRRSAPTKPG